MQFNWLTQSIFALTTLSVMSFLITFLTRKGVPVSFVMLGIGIIFTVFYCYHTFVVLQYKMQPSFSTFGLLFVIGALSVVGNLALFQAANSAPNPGLAIAIGAGLQSGLIAVLAFFILKDKLTTIQMLGLVLSIAAVLMITLGGNKTDKKTSAIKDTKTVTASK